MKAKALDRKGCGEWGSPRGGERQLGLGWRPEAGEVGGSGWREAGTRPHCCVVVLA
jgi:hypothetical protein